MPRYVLQRFADPAAFAEAAEGFLSRAEADHCLQLGLVGAVRRGEWRDAHLAVVHRDGRPALVAMRTPPHPLILSRTVDPESLRPLLDAHAALPPEAAPSGVLGPATVADAYVRLWSAATGGRARLTLRQRIHRLTAVAAVPDVPGRARRATTADRPLLESWLRAFMTEALPDAPGDAGTAVRRWLSSPGRELWFWQHGGRPVAMAGVGNPTPHGIRISAVYTPPARRRRGYASALVAWLSRRELDAGRAYCFLFSDVANPTSNRIYARIGYRPTSRVHEYRFEAARPPTA